MTWLEFREVKLTLEMRRVIPILRESVLLSNSTGSVAEDASRLKSEISVGDVGQDDGEEGALGDGGGRVL